MFKQGVTKRCLAGGLLVAAASFPAAAQARFDLNPSPPPAASAPLPAASRPSVHQGGPSTEAGFQWGDAGLGAAGTVVLLGTGATAVGIARRRRVHRTAIG